MLGWRIWWILVFMQSLTRSTSSSRLKLNFIPLHLNHRFTAPPVYSCGSLLNTQPGTPSSTVRTVKDRSELTAIHKTAIVSHTDTDFVCLSPRGGGGGVWNFMTSLVQSAISAIFTFCTSINGRCLIVDINLLTISRLVTHAPYVYALLLLRRGFYFPLHPGGI